jgi:hypothetical protein
MRKEQQGIYENMLQECEEVSRILKHLRTRSEIDEVFRDIAVAAFEIMNRMIKSALDNTIECPSFVSRTVSLRRIQEHNAFVTQEGYEKAQQDLPGKTWFANASKYRLQEDKVVVLGEGERKAERSRFLNETKVPPYDQLCSNSSGFVQR